MRWLLVASPIRTRCHHVAGRVVVVVVGGRGLDRIGPRPLQHNQAVPLQFEGGWIARQEWRLGIRRRFALNAGGWLNQTYYIRYSAQIFEAAMPADCAC